MRGRCCRLALSALECLRVDLQVLCTWEAAELLARPDKAGQAAVLRVARGGALTDEGRIERDER